MNNTNNTIALIGHGHLGHALADKIQNLQISEGRGHNKELAEKSDVIILTVRPAQVEQAVTEIRNQLTEGKVLLSFAAAFPNDKLDELSPDSTNVRAMTDIEFKQIISEKNGEVGEILSTISEFPILQKATGKDIDAFTVQIGCLPGVAAWQYAHNADADQWLEQLAIFTETEIEVPAEVSRSIIEKVKANGSYEQTVEEVATPGGVTAALIHEMIRGESDAENLYQAGMKRIKTIAENL